MKEKLVAISFGLTTSLVFLLWVLFKNSYTGVPILDTLVSGLMSYGFYRVVFYTISSFLPKSKKIKKWLLGKKYLEGTWVGFYRGSSGEIRIFYEKYLQTNSIEVINGNSFLLDGTEHSSWQSTSLNMNVAEKKLYFTYQSQGIKDISSGNGYAQFNVFLDSKDKYPIELVGYTFDLPLKMVCESKEKKVKDDLSKEALLESAKLFYNENQGFIRNR